LPISKSGLLTSRSIGFCTLLCDGAGNCFFDAAGACPVSRLPASSLLPGYRRDLGASPSARVKRLPPKKTDAVSRAALWATTAPAHHTPQRGRPSNWSRVCGKAQPRPPGWQPIAAPVRSGPGKIAIIAWYVPPDNGIQCDVTTSPTTFPGT